MSHRTASPAGRARRASRRLTALLSALSLAALGTVTAAPALADEPGPQSCWTDVDTGTVECFDSTIDPIAYIEEATGGEVLAVPSTDPGRLDGDPGLFDVFLLATVYDNTGFGTPSMTYSTSNPAICGITHNFSSLGSWDDRIESFQSFNGCSVVFYLNPGFLPTSPIFGPASSSTDIGATFRNDVSSLRIG